MSPAIKQAIDRIDALNLRERGLLLLAVVFVLYTIWDTFLMQPLNAVHKQIKAEVAQLESSNEALAQQTEAMSLRQSEDPDAPNRALIETLEGDIAGLDARLNEQTRNLINPVDMARMLEEVLTRETDLKLISIASLGAKPLFDADMKPQAGDTDAAIPGIYRHGISIEFEGGYLSTMKYLRALEQLPWRLFWDSVAFKVERYPNSRVTITVHTLSLREGWIGV
jgi:MSHA biogenesis protein MshJ